MVVKFFFCNASIKLPEKRKLKHFLVDLFGREEKAAISLTYVFCSDEYLYSINKQFLNHDDFTDIISFCLSESPDAIVGEIYISIERVKENSKELGVKFIDELHRVIFHGALHLCGYRDKTPGEKQKMTRAENMYLKMYFS